MTALDKIKKITEFLRSCGIEDAHKESEIIVTHALKIDRTVLYRDNPVISKKNAKGIDVVLQRRAKREPLQYILGYVEFCGLKIKVGKGVLIPRPETELLEEEVIKAVTRNTLHVTEKTQNSLHITPHALHIIDLCTGSGCLALAIAKHFPDADVYGTDISKDAIRYANENARLNNIANVSFLKGSLFEPLKQIMFSDVQSFKFDVIVSNPPYIRSTDMPNLQPEINKWEPRNALDGGEDGLNYYRTIFSEAQKYLTPPCPPLRRGGWGGGVIFLEIGEGQAAEVSGIAMQNGFGNISVIKDYAGIERIIAARAL
ncbi:MAG: peptide chain release factor N(5)-glutamine methyltransferase [Thermodesulfovibrionales bacterium]|nr:peptide chain release factor N(5)-glutamine methyltransferase [Thermodesulfovibrionales bacterium]